MAAVSLPHPPTPVATVLEFWLSPFVLVDTIPWLHLAWYYFCMDIWHCEGGSTELSEPFD